MAQATEPNLLSKIFEAFLSGASEKSPLLNALADQFKKKKKKPVSGGGGTTSTSKSKSKPDFFEALLTGLSERSGRSSNTGIPQAPPIADAPQPPRGDPAVQKMLEEVILSLGGLK